ncbi:hypothetical protein DL770_003193 [Monosporascus sp. CRB-9-2]|nr:hypothetical protein DL770_003193 [Monosporascus sp. CRB-9-2]
MLSSPSHPGCFKSSPPPPPVPGPRLSVVRGSPRHPGAGNRASAAAVSWSGSSSLLRPYFGWRSTHHHFVNNITTDFNYIPPTRAEYGELLLRGRGRRVDIDFNLGNNYHHHYHHTALVEDMSAVILLCISLQ